MALQVWRFLHLYLANKNKAHLLSEKVACWNTIFFFFLKHKDDEKPSSPFFSSKLRLTPWGTAASDLLV